MTNGLLIVIIIIIILKFLSKLKVSDDILFCLCVILVVGGHNISIVNSRTLLLFWDDERWGKQETRQGKSVNQPAASHQPATQFGRCVSECDKFGINFLILFCSSARLEDGQLFWLPGAPNKAANIHVSSIYRWGAPLVPLARPENCDITSYFAI